MDKMSKWIVKYRNMILAVAIVLLIPSAIGYFNTNINYDLLSYLPSTSESMKTQKILGDDFNLSSVDFLVVNNKTDQEAAKIKEEINKIDGVEKCIWRDDVLDISVPKQAIPESIQDMLYSGDSTMMIVTFKEPTSSMRTMNAISKIKKYTKDEKYEAIHDVINAATINSITKKQVLNVVSWLFNKQQKYRWHDLRKNPTDLPDVPHPERTWFEVVQEDNEDCIPRATMQYDDEYGFGFYQEIYAARSFGYVDTEFKTVEELNLAPVVAWKAIEGFESETE